MSGGVDSSMTVRYLQEAGYHVLGVTFKMTEGIDNNHAGYIADKLSIEHIYMDLTEKIENTVVHYFVGEYLQGRTPSPCVYCNENIKFPVLLDLAKQYDADYVATGHYVNKVKRNNLFYISSGIDKTKDQSYYLWKLDQNTLVKALFPLGGKHKSEVKQKACKLGFKDLSERNESMGICFLRNKNYRDFLIEHSPEILKNIGSGEVINPLGKVIGSHHGYPFYTIGQKTGMAIKENGLFYIYKIIPKENKIMVDKKQNLKTNEIQISDYFFQDIKDIGLSQIKIKVRGLGLNPEGFCKIEIIDKYTARVFLENKAWAIAPGQPVVFYHKNLTIGGGYAN